MRNRQAQNSTPPGHAMLPTMFDCMQSPIQLIQLHDSSHTSVCWKGCRSWEGGTLAMPWSTRGGLICRLNQENPNRPKDCNSFNNMSKRIEKNHTAETLTVVQKELKKCINEIQ